MFDNHDHQIVLYEDTHNPHPRSDTVILLYISPIRARHVPEPPVTVKAMSICQLGISANIGNPYVVTVGIDIGPMFE